MALKTVGARTEGDVFQGLFFWRQASALLVEGSKVRQVDLEHDEATGVDDVAVFYEEPGIDAGGWLATADYYQVKYHVDRRKAYSAEALIDPKFINAKSSLLERFYAAFSKLSTDHLSFRLHLASNWRWMDGDPLASVLREFDGSLPDAFFSAGKRSKLGKIRESWRAHLGLEPADFEAFGRRLRFQLDHFGRRHFREMCHDRLAAAGLSVPSAEKATSPYEALVQQFLMGGPNSFDAASLREICEREGLFTERTGAPPPPRTTLGIRSFVRFAERLEEETDEFLCVAQYFHGRHPKKSSSWEQAASDLIAFLGDVERRNRLRAVESALQLECHASFALLTGYELSRSSGCAAYPVQKPGRALWKPGAIGDSVSSSWDKGAPSTRNAAATDVAVALSVANEIEVAVTGYLDGGTGPNVASLQIMRPQTGVGHDAVKNADHAHRLATDLVPALREARTAPTSPIHLFVSAPNSLLFFLGQFREALGPLAVYEYDFGFERHQTYECSINFPPNAPAADDGNTNGTSL